MDPSVRFEIPETVVAAHVDAGSEAVLLHLGTKEYYQLNDTAACIWRAVERGLTHHEIVEKLLDEFDVPRDQAVHALDRILTDLLERNLLAPRTEDG